MLLLNFIICGIFAIEIARCLNPSDVMEGPCIATPAASNFDAKWFRQPGRMWANSGGSKYFLYQIATGYPEFSNLREFEFYYDSCLQVFFEPPGANVLATAYGFNQSVASFKEIVPGVIQFSTNPPVPVTGEIFTSTITLTDNNTFAFSAKCFTGLNQRGWDLFTINPQIVTAEFQKKIENHAVSLGFNRDYFVFLRYDNCKHLFTSDTGAGWR